jgi:hypothetical protein
VAAQLQSAATAGHSAGIATVATVSAAIESSLGKRSVRARLPKECQSPTEWFIADDDKSHTRYFVLQVRCALQAQAGRSSRGAPAAVVGLLRQVPEVSGLVEGLFSTP